MSIFNFNVSSALKCLRGQVRPRASWLAVILTISVISSVLVPATVGAAEYYVSESGVYVRTGPGTDYMVLGSLPVNYVFSLQGTETDDEGNLWYAVPFNGGTGYISGAFIEELTDDTEEVMIDVIEEPEITVQEPATEPAEEESSTSDAEPAGDDSKDPAQEESSEASPDEEETEEVTSDEEDEEEDDEELVLFAKTTQPSWSGTVQSEAAFEAQLNQFPESYRAGLRAIHAVYPNYTFTADYINMDFQELVDAQIGKKISAYYASSWKAMYDDSFGYYENYDWDSGEWYNSEGMFTYASREVIEHYIDPRNYLDTSDIYVFMRQSYTSDQTVDDLRSIIQGSFLADGYTPSTKEANDKRLGGDYAAVIMEAAQKSGTSPYVLAASIILEHGYSGETPLISGYYKANDGTVYKSYYNFFDIGATGGDSDNVIQNGLEYAKAQGWTSRYLSIVNGAIWTADGYASNGQDTYYYREFNVINGWNSLWHQYSTGILTAQVSASLMKSALAGNTYAALDFRIPVYQNMPATPSSEPAYNDKLNNYYFTDMQATGLEPEFSMANRDYTMTVTGNTVLSISVPQWATYEGKSSYALSAGTNVIKMDVRSQTGYLRTYTITVTASRSATLTVNTYEGNHLNIFDNDNTGGDYVWGDANGDGKVSSLDYIAIKNHIMDTKKITDATRFKGADTNGDGKISALDYIAIKNYIMSK